MEFVNSILESRYFTLAVISSLILVFIVTILIWLAWRKRLPAQDRFGLTKDEQRWFRLYEPNSKNAFFL